MQQSMQQSMQHSIIRDHQKHSGFTLIELVMAIAVLAISLTVVSKGLQTINSRSVSPVIYLQANWIAAAYLNEIQHRVERGLLWCDVSSGDQKDRDKNSDRRARMEFTSLCQYMTNQPLDIKDIAGDSIASLADYQIEITFEAVDTGTPLKDSLLEGLTVLGEQSPTQQGLKVIANVYHPLIQSITLERWIWST